ncbi:tumor necrosis factor receptor superfamily member 14-like isoform X1 [Equus caballus]|uniref:tumor necrosis factor receptor superfamily member 14-like isoform X1 n=1 Tax=Equus caballus TaxID=9796 RepID=UPI0038B2F417
MEPLRGWGPPPWSPAPKADALSLLPGSPRLTQPSVTHSPWPWGRGADTQESHTHQQQNSSWWASSPKPHSADEGYRVKQTCVELTGMLCIPCAPGTFSAQVNGLSKCLPCRPCDPAMGLVIKWDCSSTENTECGCDQGHFCVSEKGDDCVKCQPHTTCRPGQRVRERGTERQDTVCEDCQPGTFSPNGTLGECRPWTKCSGLFEMEVEPGTSSTDITCSSRGLSVLVGVLVLVLAGLIVLCVWMKMRRTSDGFTPVRFLSQWTRPGVGREDTAAQALQPTPDVTTVAVEETAAMFPEREQHADRQPQMQPSEKSLTVSAESCQALKG